MRIVQYRNNNETALAVVKGDKLQCVHYPGGLYALASWAISANTSLIEAIEKNLTTQEVDYQDIINEGNILPPVMHPDPAHCLVAGTGLTHLGSADTRSSMHSAMAEEAKLTDSMKMFKLGVEGGKPSEGKIGSQPEWFYKGNGHTIVPPFQPIPVPGCALDAGEEPELVGIYIIGGDKQPYRLGFAIGNEFSDHVTERGNYLWLAHSKLRFCSLGPELLIGELPKNIKGISRIYRDGVIHWQKEFLSGEDNMSHSISNLEHHHFKYPQFCIPGDLHIHFFGTSTLSFADEVNIRHQDICEIQIDAFGKSLCNKIDMSATESLTTVNCL